jgi:hypothetical protein
LRKPRRTLSSPRAAQPTSTSICSRSRWSGRQGRSQVRSGREARQLRVAPAYHFFVTWSIITATRITPPLTTGCQ